MGLREGLRAGLREGEGGNKSDVGLDEDMVLIPDPYGTGDDVAEGTVSAGLPTMAAFGLSFQLLVSRFGLAGRR